METVRIFERFKLDEINEDWIKCIWATDLMAFEKPPAEDLMFLESEHMRLLLYEASTVVKSSLTGAHHVNDTINPLSWNLLRLYEINVQALLAVLGYIINSGQNQFADEDSRESCLNASSLYFILLAVPGSTVFNVFHPHLYERAIDSFKLSDHLIPAGKRYNKSMHSESIQFSEDTRTFNNSLNPEEVENLQESLLATIHDFILMLNTFWLKHHVRSLEVSIRGLFKLITTGCTMETALSQSAFDALEKLCDDNHGPIGNTIMLVVKYTLPYFLYNQAHNQKKYVATIQQSVIHFLQHLLCTYKNAAEGAFLVLAQQLMIECPDRAEPRQKQALVVIKFLSICKQSIIIKACIYLIYLSHDARVQNRIFALEIIGKILAELHLNEFSELENNLKRAVKQTLVATVLSRCVDCSNLVRGKALAIIADYTDCNKNMENKMIFKISERNAALPNVENLKESLLDKKNVLPGMDTFIGILVHRLEDKSAVVRKSALAIFENLAKISPFLLEQAIPLISRRCRDPALTVRGLAVQILTHLLEEFSDNSELLNEWVHTVVPQIFDVDAKIQQKVLQCFQDLLLNRIEMFSPSIQDNGHNLPWRILIRISRERMSKDLSKACSLWTKNGTITKTVVHKIQSHIESVNDTAAWILLSALADTMVLPDIEKYISNYRMLLQSSDFRASLILEVLKKCRRSLEDDALKELRSYLLEQLEQLQIDFRFISICMDIINEATKYLYPKTGKALIEESMTNLIQISEDEISKILNCESSTFRMSGNSLKAMCTLGNATLFCHRKVSPQVLRILQGILLDQNISPSASSDVGDLQVFAVVILGQQALRDRDTAQKAVPLFGKLLRQETDTSSQKKAALKINCAKALADICIRFTALVDPYLPDLCISMKDSNLQIRRTIIIILIRLLLEDFVKMKGPFFFHVLTMLCDLDGTIRELTTFLIEESLLVKNKTLVSQRFVESIYHYNDYKSRQDMRKKEREVLTLPGRRNQDKRRTIYDFMLEHLDPPGKLTLLVKLTRQVLGGVCEGMVDITKEEGACVLKDALYIICNERLQPRSFTKEADESQETEEPTPQVATPTTNALKILLDGFRRHGQEVLLPLLIRLIHKISPLSSPLENDVKRLLVKTFQSYNKEQLVSLLMEYPTLEKDIECYQRCIEQQKHLKKAADVEETKHIQLTAVLQSSLTPRVTLRRLTQAEIVKWTDSPSVTGAKISVDCSWFTTESNVSHPSETCGPCLTASTPKSRTNSLSMNNCNGIPQSKRYKLSTIYANASKRRILDVESLRSID